jgi:membrane fusion protein (multidrug efflux system)
MSLLFISLPACQTRKEEEMHAEQHKVVVTNPKLKDVVVTQQYVCQIHSQRHINVRALQNG